MSAILPVFLHIKIPPLPLIRKGFGGVTLSGDFKAIYWRFFRLLKAILKAIAHFAAISEAKKGRWSGHSPRGRNVPVLCRGRMSVPLPVADEGTRMR